MKTTFATLLLFPFIAVIAAEPVVVGQRPYEMAWADRTKDHYASLIDFEELAGWAVECRNAEATLERTREQQIWGRHVGKLTYRGTGGGPEIRLMPPKPVPIGATFDAVTLWVYGNNWGWTPDPKTPQVNVSALLLDSQKKEFAVPLYRVDFKEWYLMHRRLTPAQIERVKNGAAFKALLITGGGNTEDRVLYFDNLTVFKEAFPPLSFEPRPRRGISMFSGQPEGSNKGPGRLPFPTRPETILPANLTEEFRTKLTSQGDSYMFTYAGVDGTLIYTVEPKTGTWGDISATWAGPAQTGQGNRRDLLVRPCVGGGIYLQTSQGPRLPERTKLLGATRQGETVKFRWKVEAEDASAEVTYTFRLWNKSLVVDVKAPGGSVGEVRFGRAEGLEAPRLVTNPYYPAQGGRPAVVVSGPSTSPVFLTGNVDWYLSNASIPWAGNVVDKQGAMYNGGTRYVPKTDGNRNDCYERFFLTISPRYEETLPTIPNPVSPWKQVTGTRLWRAHGASKRERDARFWTDNHRWGMTQVVVTDHETGWRDGGESFTFRTKAAPGKGGDKGQYDYARLMQDQLGYVYGPYNNYTDFAPVNEYWSFDMVSRTPDNQLQHAWMRCYAPKPARAVEYCARLAPEIERKFHFSTAYCDVHTAVAPWHRVDYDPRVPGAGTFGAVYYAYGEIMLLQKKAWDGPVYSEGNYHSFYSGLTDGNYGQDQSYRLARNPWLVDFDLRKIHDLCCNFGMGNPNMFYSGQPPPRRTRQEKDAWIDRFLAATVAFGHPGFLTYEGGLQNALRSYYMLQQLHSRYCLASADEIRYANAQGELLDTSSAVGSGAHERSQVVTRYSDGTITAVNGSPEERMRVKAYNRTVDLPPNGYAGWTEDKSVEVWSRDLHGHRHDYAVSPAYLYIDGRGQFVRQPKAAGNGIGICRILPDNEFEIILHENAECGFAIHAEAVIALDKAGKELGPAHWRVSRGLTYIQPVQNAFSYKVSGPVQSGSGVKAPVSKLSCQRSRVFAGEQVTVKGQGEHLLRIPSDTRAGKRIWVEREQAWIDFTVVPLTRTALAIEGNALRMEVTSHLANAAEFEVTAKGKKSEVRLVPGHLQVLRLDMGIPQAESSETLKVNLTSGDLTQKLERQLQCLRGIRSMGAMPEKWTKGMRLRAGQEVSDFGETRTVVEPRQVSSGHDSKAAMFMHPPYMGGVGYAFALYEPMIWPGEVPSAFRAMVGKGDGSDPGDGILYRVAVVDETGRETIVAEKRVTKHGWVPIEADLSLWGGQRIALKLITDVGPNDNSSGDWGCWAEMRIETVRPVFHWVLK